MKKLFIGIILILCLLAAGISSFYLLGGDLTITNSSENFLKNKKAEIHFSKKMDKSSVENSIEIDPELKTKLSWREEKTLIIEIDESEEIENFSVIIDSTAKDSFGRTIEIPRKIDFFVLPKNIELSLTTPQNKSKNITGKMPITFLWDGPIFPLQRADIWQEKLEKTIQMEPKIDGSWSILGTSGILFEPKENWPASTEVNITVGKELIEKPVSLNFQTPLLDITYLSAIDLLNQKPLYIHFNQDIDLAKISKKIHFEPNIKFNLEYGKQNIQKNEKEIEKIKKSTLVITPKESWPTNTNYTVTIDKGLFANAGNLSTETELKKSFYTISPFILNSRLPSNSRHSVQLTFSHPINSKDLAKHLKIYPEVSNEKWTDYTKKWTENSYQSSYFYINPIDSYWTPNEQYTIIVDSSLNDIYERSLESEYKTDFYTVFQNQISSLYFPDNHTVFPSTATPKFVFKYTGKARDLRVELASTIPNMTEEFTLSLADSQEVESVFEINLAENFPNLFPGKKIITGKYTIKIFESDKKWPIRSSSFYVSDFAVGIKDYADNRFQVFAESFEGAPINEAIKEINIWDNNFLEKSIKNFNLNDSITANYNMVIIKRENGEIGIGSSSFDKKMSKYDAKVSFSPWAYKEDTTGVMLTDRPLFRPGDEVYFKSIFRTRENFGKNFPLKNTKKNQEQTYRISIMNPFWEEVFTTDATAHGGELNGSWVIPADSPLGSYQLIVHLNETEISTSFHVQKFRKPKFLIDAKFDKNNAISKDKINAKISAKYAFGGSLAHKKLTYKISLFGEPKNCIWWCDKEDKIITSGEGILDDNGEFNIPIDLDIEEKTEHPIDWNTLTLNATITASADEKSSIEKSVKFFQAERILTLDSGRYFYPPKTKIKQTGKLTDLDNKSIKDEVTAQLYLEKWVRNDRKNVDGDFYGEWKRSDEKIWEKLIDSDKNGIFALNFTTPEKSGNYFLRFTAFDKSNRSISIEKYFWISGSDFQSIQKNEQNRILQLFTDKNEYKINEDVELFFPLTDFEINPETSFSSIERGEILEKLPLDIDNRIIRLKTEAWMAPNIYVSVLLTGKDKDNNQDIRWGTIKVPVTDPNRKLEISLEPIKKIYKPGDEIEVKIKTTINGSPTPASITISVVDQTLLALMSRPKLNIWMRFLADLPLGVSTYHTLANFTSQEEITEILDEIEKIKSRLALGHGGGGASDSKGGEFKPRGDFKDTATFIAKIDTNESGEAIAKFKAPDNLTIWNIWAIGHTTENAFGETESSTQVTLPMLISEILPNGFQSGDEAQIGILIRRNNTDKKSAKIKVKLNLPDGVLAKQSEKEVLVEEESRIFFTIKIKELTDLKKEFKEIKIGFEIESDDGLRDSLVVKRKIFPPKVTLSEADFIRVENTKKIRIFPDFVNAVSSKLSIKLNPSIVTKLETLIDITQKMNYGCAEQRLSKSTAVLLQKELDKTLEKDSPEINKKELIENRDYIEKSFTNNGFGYWSHSNRPNVWVSTNILENADLWEKYDVRFDSKKLEKTQKYLHEAILKTCNKDDYYWNCLDDTTRNHAAAILAKNKVLTISDLDFLTKNAKTFEAKIWWIRSARLLSKQGFDIPPTSKKFEKIAWTGIKNNLKIQDRYIFWEESNRVFYSQNERLTAIALEEVILANKWTEYQHKIARYLIESKSKNLSGNTAMRMLKTLKLYTQKYEVENFDAAFLVKTISNQEELIKGEFEKLDQTIEFHSTLNEDKQLTGFDGIELFATNKKTFYADIELKEVFPADKITPVSKGFFLERNIYSLDDVEFKKPLTKLETGKNYIVRLRIITNTSHRQVVLVDYAPAGAEFINLSFGNTDKTLQSHLKDKKCYGWCRPNFDHQEFHEISARFFADYIGAGTHEVKYLIQARIAGDFEILPAKIEEMYFPEVFATTKGEKIEIK